MSHGSVIIAEDWIKFKQVIHDLYVKQNLPLEGTRGVMAVMKTVHGFTKSKSQYVLQLGKWNYKKYSKDTDPHDWKVAGYKVDKARKRGKEVQLHLKGNLVTGKVLRTRGYLTSLDQLQLEGSSPRTPPNFNLFVQSPAPPSTSNLPFTKFWDDIKSFELPSQSVDAVEFKTTVIDPYNSTAAQHAQSLMSLYLPASSTSAIPQLLEYSDQHTQIEQWWRFITCVLSNNHLTNLDHEDGHKLFRALKQANIPRMLNSAPFSRKPTAKAFLERVFRLAIEAEDLETVQYLLETDLNPNGHSCYHPDCPPNSHVNPLQFVLLSGNLPMAELLVHHNAKLDEPHAEWRSSAIVLAILGWRARLEPRVVDEEDASLQRREDVITITAFVRSLITHGAKVNTDHLGIHLRGHSNRFQSSLGVSWRWLDRWQSPLIIAARYQLSELLGMFLDNHPHCPTTDDINSALGASLYHCAEWRFRPNHEADIPQYPFAIASLLQNAGADVTVRFDYNSHRDKYLISSPLDLLAYYTAWGSGAADGLSDHHQKPTIGAVLDSMNRKDFFLCSQLFSSYNYSVCRDPELFLVLRHLRPYESHWMFGSLDEMSDLDLQSMVLLQALNFCTPQVSKELLMSCKCAAEWLSEQPSASVGRLIVPALSTMTLEHLQCVYGENLQAFLWNMAELDTGLIHTAITHGNSSLATYLIHEGLNVNEVVKYKNISETALCAATRQGNSEMIDLLLARDAKLEIDLGLCQCGHAHRVNVLVVATEYGDADLIHRLVARGANPNDFGSSEALHSERYNTYFRGISNLGGALCTCGCVVPLVACLLSRNWLVFQALLDVGASTILTETARGFGNHFTPLAALVCGYHFGEIPEHITYDPIAERGFRDFATQALLDAGASPLDASVLGVADCKYRWSRTLVETLLRRIIAQSTPGENTSDAETLALIQAIKLRNPVFVDDLLKRGIATTAIDRYDKYPSPLHVALFEVSQKLFKGWDKQYDIVSYLLRAGYGQHGSIRVSELEWVSPVHQAVRDGDRILLKLLLDFGIRPLPSQYRVYGCLADPRVPLDMIKTPFDYGIQPIDVETEVEIWVMGLPPRNPVAATALQVASALGYPEAAQFLVLHGGADVNAPGNEKCGATALQFALVMEHYDIAQLLIENGADANAPPSSLDGTTCLQVVASRGDLNWVKVLVRADADVNAAPHPERHPGGTALQHAVKNGSLDVARYLVDHDATVNAAPDPEGGATALQYAAIYGFGAIVEFLIRHDANVQAKAAENNGRTALEGAAENGRLDITQLLLDYDAGCGGEDQQNGQRACELAEANGHFAIQGLIRGYLEAV
ncbi:hypothetical protein BKA56DRAFT_650322 [Ilyonectria sp. MPI-CAGE-AT-0026]|nr:hypothetical protein BKA56DRAFT_650322 [Ilyonectria sp. MPI-CAGE-AT-0026]